MTMQSVVLSKCERTALCVYLTPLLVSSSATCSTARDMGGPRGPMTQPFSFRHGRNYRKGGACTLGPCSHAGAQRHTPLGFNLRVR